MNLHAESVRVLEAKCLSMNPVFPEYLAIGGSDAFIRMYDRRKLKCNVIEVRMNNLTILFFSILRTVKCNQLQTFLTNSLLSSWNPIKKDYATRKT